MRRTRIDALVSQLTKPTPRGQRLSITLRPCLFLLRAALRYLCAPRGAFSPGGLLGGLLADSLRSLLSVAPKELRRDDGSQETPSAYESFDAAAFAPPLPPPFYQQTLTYHDEAGHDDTAPLPCSVAFPAAAAGFFPRHRDPSSTAALVLRTLLDCAQSATDVRVLLISS